MTEALREITQACLNMFGQAILFSVVHAQVIQVGAICVASFGVALSGWHTWEAWKDWQVSKQDGRVRVRVSRMELVTQATICFVVFLMLGVSLLLVGLPQMPTYMSGPPSHFSSQVVVVPNATTLVAALVLRRYVSIVVTLTLTLLSYWRYQQRQHVIHET